MSVIEPTAGLIPNVETSLFSPPGVNSCSITIRVSNFTNATQQYNLDLYINGAKIGPRVQNLNIPAFSYVDVEKGLKLPANAELSHFCNSANALTWSLTGVQDDGN